MGLIVGAARRTWGSPARCTWGALPDLVLVLPPVVFCCLPVTAIMQS
jgi:hypothetical protein